MEDKIWDDLMGHFDDFKDLEYNYLAEQTFKLVMCSDEFVRCIDDVEQCRVLEDLDCYR